MTLRGLTKSEGMIAAVIAIVTAGGGYFVFRATTDYQLIDHAKKIDDHDKRIVVMEMIGHPDHERRISKLEVRADSTEKTVSEINAKLDVAVALLQRIDREQQRLQKNGEK